MDSRRLLTSSRRISYFCVCLCSEGEEGKLNLRRAKGDQQRIVRKFFFRLTAIASALEKVFSCSADIQPGPIRYSPV